MADEGKKIIAKRRKNVAEWERNRNKKLRNEGKEYVSLGTKRIVPARVIGPPCKDGCFDKLGENNVHDMFSNYWNLSDYNAQTSYLQNCVKAVDIKRRRTNAIISRKKCNYAYFVPMQNTIVGVCPVAFRSLHGITENRVRCALKKISPTGTLIEDQRGKNPNPRAISLERKQGVIKHIQKFSTIESDPGRTYQPGELNICKLYESYQEWNMVEYPDIERVSEHYYRDTFKDYLIAANNGVEAKNAWLKLLYMANRPSDINLHNDKDSEKFQESTETANTENMDTVYLENAESVELENPETTYDKNIQTVELEDPDIVYDMKKATVKLEQPESVYDETFTTVKLEQPETVYAENIQSVKIENSETVYVENISDVKLENLETVYVENFQIEELENTETGNMGYENAERDYTINSGFTANETWKSVEVAEELRPSTRSRTFTPQKTEKDGAAAPLKRSVQRHARKMAEEQIDPNDHLYHFFLSMYEMTKKMPPVSQHLVKNRVFQAVSEVEADLLNINPS